MERLFQILAAILAGVAVFFLWKGNKDGTFIAAVFGAVCFFLSVRFQVKERMKKLEAEEFAAQESENSAEESKGEDK
jgi:uncharacterized membrane protein YjjP (DUF1212 family)